MSQPMVVPIHSTVPGRVRFQVAGLYRAEPSCQARFETRLSAFAGIHHAAANTLTGNLLLQFDGIHKNLDELAALVEREAVAAGLGNGRSPADHLSPSIQATKSAQQPLPSQAFVRRHPAPPKLPYPAATMDLLPWHALDRETLLKHFETSPYAGLDSALAKARLARYGPNLLEEPTARSSLSILLNQFSSLPVALLGGAAAISLVTGGILDAAAILAVVLINAGIGYFTEQQAEKTIRSLAHFTPQSAAVLRDGMVSEIPVQNIVVGDLLVLVPGTYVAADARLIEARQLTLDESALTGESQPVAKTAAATLERESPLAERKNMVYAGTHMLGGSGLAVVTATGQHTELGTIQALAGATPTPPTPMQTQLDRMGTQLVLISGAVCGVVFVIGLLRGYGGLQMLKTAISLAVAALPEGLPTVATTTLALGIRNMRRHQVLIRRLDAVETLGAVQLFCLDKTGTLTLNRMSVVAVRTLQSHLTVAEGRFQLADEPIDPIAYPDLRQLLHIVALCRETASNGHGTPLATQGSPTESALIEMALQAGLDLQALQACHHLIETGHRAEGKPFMHTVHAETDGGGRLVAVKGSPTEVLALCRWGQEQGIIVPLSSQHRDAISAENDLMAGEALRVLGVAYSPAASAQDALEQGLIWVGLVGMTDPLRPGMNELVNVFHRAGIRPVMITGDQSATAQAIGKQLSLNAGGPLEILDSSHLDRLEQQALAGVAQNVHVFARVSPAHKLRIVQALQRGGKVVAMTGDGINDGPALKAANIGVAMGGSGTDTARSVADVILKDDQLTTMVIAVTEGRTTYKNIRKSLRFLLATNLSEIEVMAAAVALGMGQPLSPMQLLWINLITDIFPGLALGMEPPETEVLDEPPRNPQQPIIAGGDFRRLLFESGVITAGTLASYGYGWLRYGPGPQAGTLAFLTLTTSQLLHALSCRSETTTVLDPGRRPPNPYLTVALLGSLGAQLLAIAVPGLRNLLGIGSIGWTDALVMAASAVTPLLINEITKNPKGRPGRELMKKPAPRSDNGVRPPPI